MPGLLDRYLAGNEVPVWAELVAMGSEVREEPFYSAALAVARETMRRARHNVELLIKRLGLLGYQFGYDWWKADYRDMLEYDPPPPMYASPRPDLQGQLALLEARVGSLPLSLRAWYEQVDAVNLVGLFPVGDPTDPGGFTSYIQFARSGGNSKGRWFTKSSCIHDLDPLFIYSLEHQLERATRSLPASGPHEIELAPDEWLKYGVSGAGPYTVRVPNPAADAAVEDEWHNTTFVNYLRICFRWGGFPGLECKSVRPEREIAFLTDGLLPI